MEYIQLNESNYVEWDTICNQSGDAWFWHTTHWMDYVMHYRPENNPRQHSFLLKDDGKIVGICPLILETYHSKNLYCFSNFGAPSPVLINEISKKARKKYLDAIFSQVDSLAHMHDVRKVMYRLMPLSDTLLVPARMTPSNFLMNYGYLDTSFNTQILYLRPSAEELKSEFRKGHKYDVNRSLQMMNATSYDASNITDEIYQAYCELHHKDAGRVTRPQKTFDLMLEWIRKGYAFLISAKDLQTNDIVGFAYLYIFKQGCYYGSACSDPEKNNMPIAHRILWEAIRWLKEHFFQYFELGWQFYSPQFHFLTSTKEQSISLFKRGFGGEQVPQILGEKYYDSELFEVEYQKKVQEYSLYLKSINSSIKDGNDNAK